MARILVAGMNPAWQQVFTLATLRPGEVQRALESFALASGKGMNAAKVLARLGHEVTLLQVVAGVNGRRMLDACEARGIRSVHVFAEGETRTATTLLHDGRTTEIIGNFRVGEGDLGRALLDQLPEGDLYDALLVCGTLPQGFDEGFHRAVLRRVNAARVIWDSVAGLDAFTAPRVSWLKVNAAEHALLKRRLEEFGARPETLVTDGPDKARVLNGAGAGTYALPRIEALNPIGAGDTVTALLAHGLLGGAPASECVRRALAAGTASCLTLPPAEWDEADAERFAGEIAWKP